MSGNVSAPTVAVPVLTTVFAGTVVPWGSSSEFSISATSCEPSGRSSRMVIAGQDAMSFSSSSKEPSCPRMTWVSMVLPSSRSYFTFARSNCLLASVSSAMLAQPAGVTSGSDSLSASIAALSMTTYVPPPGNSDSGSIRSSARASSSAAVGSELEDVCALADGSALSDESSEHAERVKTAAAHSATSAAGRVGRRFMERT
ncbi:hypothetical protein [Williamsia sp. DF01-3]|uniref:hypothetical protein n=1 Tax=Williamsia sp. DF01-3 TaxID=2934157 RepID=UPI001FF0E255|nr:hypothetical protein [Williamsia sp. DF01-3]MCK0519670.1 hypothetical protein [Williamsia sp. DF01-3]